MRILDSYCVLLVILSPLVGWAQSVPQLRALHQAAQEGRVTELRGQLESVDPRYRDDAGFVYLQGLAESNGDSAVVYYRTVMNKYPKSEWADDALWRLFQFSSAIGAYTVADEWLARLRVDYPSSPYASMAEVKSASKGSTAVATVGTTEFSVQVGAFRHREQAEDLMEMMTKKGFDARVVEKTVGAMRMTAVWVGRFSNADAARNLARKVKQRFDIEGIIVRSQQQ